MRVTEVAKQTGVPSHVVRYYARIGLLVPHRNPNNGYRMFSNGDVERMRFIRLAQCLGYSLREINDMLAAMVEGARPCGWTRCDLDKRLQETRRQIAQLRRRERCIELASDQGGLFDEKWVDLSQISGLIESLLDEDVELHFDDD